MPTKSTLVLTYEVHAEPQRVFDALTQPRHLDKYFTSGASVDLQVGGRMNLGEGESGKFLKVAVPRQVSFSYTHPRIPIETEVDIQLAPSFPLGGTRLRLVHKAHAPKQLNAETVEWLELRWKYFVTALAAHLSGDKPAGFDAWKADLSPVYAPKF